MATRSLKELAEEAYQVQDASNLSGVVHGFSRAITELREYVKGGTDELNRHPICILWADKIAHLTGTQGDTMRFSEAWDTVDKLRT